MNIEHSSKPELSLPGSLAIGSSSPVQKSIRLIYKFFNTQPTPNLNADAAKRTGLLAANHLLTLADACGLLNGSGMHSAAVVLLRSLEDALDIFCAVTSVPHAAERWELDNLKPSEAAKLWVEHLGNPTISTGQTLTDYRKRLRHAFNKYSHASYELCLWDLYFQPQKAEKNKGLTGTIEINSYPRHVINTNGHSIDAHLTAHLLEFIDATNTAYSSALKNFPDAKNLVALLDEIHVIMQKHNLHGCQDVQTPAELRKLRKPKQA